MEQGLHHTKQIEKIIFKKPLIIYKLSSDKALTASLKMIEYFLNIDTTEEIYLEDLQLMKSCFDCPVNWEITMTKTCKNISKLKQFNLKEHKSDLCIVIGGDGTIVWANSIFESESRPPFLTFNLGTLGYMAIYFFENYSYFSWYFFLIQKLILFKVKVNKNSVKPAAKIVLYSNEP